MSKNKKTLSNKQKGGNKKQPSECIVIDDHIRCNIENTNPNWFTKWYPCNNKAINNTNVDWYTCDKNNDTNVQKYKCRPSLPSDKIPQGRGNLCEKQEPVLKNESNMCYMNSIIRCLFVIDDLIDTILNNNFVEELERTSQSKNDDGKITYLFLYFIYSIIRGQDSVENSKNNMAIQMCPMIFKNQWNVQEDASEFTTKIIEALSVSYGKIIENIFNIEMIKNHKYIQDVSGCRNKIGPISKVVNDTMILLPIIDENTQNKIFQNVSKINEEISKIKDMNLSDLLNNYFQPTRWNFNCNYDDNLTKTERDKIPAKEVLVETTININKSPPWLIIALLRFINDPMRNNRYKIKNKINMSETFNMSNNTYELRAISAHTGTLSSGHYIAYIKMNNQWIVYNDSIVEPYDSLKNILEDHNYKTFTPYILFYKKIK